MLASRLRSLWRNFRHRASVDADLDAEIAAMRDLLADEKTSTGMSAPDAHRLAAAELGGVESLKEQVREARAGALLDTLGKDVRFGLRLLRRNPLFAATACISLAIGIGATTSIFTIANALLLKPAAGVSEPDRLVDVVITEAGEFGVNEIAYPDYLEIRRHATTLSDVFAYDLQARSASLKIGASSAEVVYVNAVTPNFFAALGVRAAAGRVFTAADDVAPGLSPVVVLSHRFWMRRFDGNPDIVGRDVRINGQAMTIAGIAASDFAGITVVGADMWIPVPMMPVLDTDRSQVLTTTNPWLLMGGRLADGATRAQAAAQVTALGTELERRRPPVAPFMPPGAVEQPHGTFRWSVEAASPIPYGVRTVAASFMTLLGLLVSVVLAIACANVAGVLLTRATVRRREIVVRLALGAARRRLVRQLLTETLLLFVIGGAAGLVLTRWITTALLKLLPAFQVPVNLDLPIDGRVMAFAATISLITAAAAGIAPALHAARTDLASVLKDEGPATAHRMRTRNAFVVAQVALSVFLVVTSGLLARALGRISAVDHGFDTTNVDVVSMDLALAGYTADSGRAFARALTDQVATLPGVIAASAVDNPPGAGGHSYGFLTVPGYTPPDGQRYVFVNWTLTEPGYFDMLRIPMLEGRDFAETDRAGMARVAVVSRSMAGRYWPGRSAVGQIINEYAGGPDGVGSTPTPVTVVGVVENLRFGGRNAARQDIYMPFAQKYSRQLTLLVKHPGKGSALAAVRAAVARLNPDLPILSAQALATQQSGPVDTQFRIGAMVAGGVGTVGIWLAMLGLYGVTAYAVARRTREIAIRLTLGAPNTHVVRLVLRQGMSLVGIGGAIGLLLGMGIAKALAGQRFNAPPADPWIFAGAVLLFVLIGLLACYVPVRRASRITAMEALRVE